MSNDNKPVSIHDEAAAATQCGTQVREGVLAVPGEIKLHFGGTLESVSIAWRLAGPAGAPVVVALGGISASRRVWIPEEPRGGWWHEVVGPRLALDTQRFRILSFDYLGASARFHRPARRRAVPDRFGLRPGRTTAAPHQSSRHRVAARHCRRVVRRHGRAGVRRALSRSASRASSSSAPRIARIRWRAPGASCSGAS